jgi:hypothetical protein
MLVLHLKSVLLFRDLTCVTWGGGRGVWEMSHHTPFPLTEKKINKKYEYL